MGDDPLWDLGLSEPVLIGVFALVVMLVAAAVAIWGAAVPEKAPPAEQDHTAQLVGRDRDRTARVLHDLEDETGRSDPAVAWTR